MHSGKKCHLNHLTKVIQTWRKWQFSSPRNRIFPEGYTALHLRIHHSKSSKQNINLRYSKDLVYGFCECWSAGPTYQPPTRRTRVSLFVWPLNLILPGKGEATSCYRRHSTRDPRGTQAQSPGTKYLRQGGDTFDWVNEYLHWSILTSNKTPK